MGRPDVGDDLLDLSSGSPRGCQDTQQRGGVVEMAFEASESYRRVFEGVKGAIVCRSLTILSPPIWDGNSGVACDFVVQLGAQCIEGLGRMLLDRLCVGKQSCGLDTQTGLQGLYAVVVETMQSEDLINIVQEYFSH